MKTINDTNDTNDTVAGYLIDDILKQSDIGAIRDLAREAGVFNEEEIDIAGCLAEEKFSGRESSYNFLFIRDEAGVPLAYTCFGEICLTDNRFDLYWIVVSPKLQGKGMGERILSLTEDATRKLGGVHLYAETSGTDLYIPARKFYLKNGYTEAARLKEYYRDGDDKYIFHKKL